MYYALTTQSMKHFFFHSVERRPFTFQYMFVYVTNKALELELEKKKTTTVPH